MTARIIAVGLIAGFTSGLFGVGGGIVIVPSLVMIVAFEQRLAHGTSLAAIVVISISGTVGYATAGEVHWSATVALVAGGLVGTVTGTHLLQRVTQHKLQLWFAVLLLATAVRLVVDTPDPARAPTLTLGTAAGLVVLGFLAGLLAGLMGVGGGVITVPALTLFAGFPLVIAKGTSLAVIVPTSLIGTLRNRLSRNVDLRAAAIIGTAGVTSSFLASKISLGLDPDLSAALFAALLLVTALRMFHTVRRESRARAGATTGANPAGEDSTTSPDPEIT